MNKKLGIFAAAGALLIALTGCSAQLGDRGGMEGAPPDKIGDVQWVEVWRNADNMPNVARICVEGVAFASTSSGVRSGGNTSASPQLVRVAEWDSFCGSKSKA